MAWPPLSGHGDPVLFAHALDLTVELQLQVQQIMQGVAVGQVVFEHVGPLVLHLPQLALGGQLVLEVGGEPVAAHDLVGPHLKDRVPGAGAGLEKPGQVAPSSSSPLSPVGIFRPRPTARLKGSFLFWERMLNRPNTVMSPRPTLSSVKEALVDCLFSPLLNQGMTTRASQPLVQSGPDSQAGLVEGPLVGLLGRFFPGRGRDEIHAVRTLVELVLLIIVKLENEPQLPGQIDRAVAGVDGAHGLGALGLLQPGWPSPLWAEAGAAKARQRASSGRTIPPLATAVTIRDIPVSFISSNLLSWLCAAVTTAMEAGRPGGPRPDVST